MAISYQKLIKTVQSEIKDSMLEAKSELEQKRVESYWHIGDFIKDYISQKALSKREEVEGFFTELSHDVEQKRYFLTKTYRFRKVYSKIPHRPGLRWSHYRLLCDIVNCYRPKCDHIASQINHVLI